MRIYKCSKVFLCVIGLLFLSIQSCLAITFDKIVVFGDSLSDNGNIYNLTVDANKASSALPIVPKTPPYFNGRFSNGPIWVELLAESLNIPLTDYAYGGSWVESYKESGQVIPFSLSAQVNYYMVAAAVDFHKDQHLYMIWAGSNDYINGRDDPEYAATNTIEVLKNQIEWLIYVGGKHFVLANLPELETLPGVVAMSPEVVEQVKVATRLHNAKLVEMVEAEKVKYPDVTFTVADLMSHYKEVITHPEDHHFTNIDTPCYSGEYYLKKLIPSPKTLQAMKDARMNFAGNLSLRTAILNGMLGDEGTVCDNPDAYFYWDRVHPTRVVHQAIANYLLTVVQDLEAQG